MTQRFILYGTYGCHLCDEARELVEPLLQPAGFEEIDILDDEALEARYGVRIPVLRDHLLERELGWPFDRAQLQEFLET